MKSKTHLQVGALPTAVPNPVVRPVAGAVPAQKPEQACGKPLSAPVIVET